MTAAAGGAFAITALDHRVATGITQDDGGIYDGAHAPIT
jgi:hypothetical protein